MEPVGHIEPQPWMTAPPTRAVVHALTADGAEVRFVGGCVRDTLAGRAVKDVDLATTDRPEKVMALLKRADIHVIPTGIDHGTVTAVVDHHPYEITTLRVDVETYGRRARVAYTDDWRDDAARRDLTINAISCSPSGDLYDPFGGVDDLAKGRIRFVGAAEQRLREDVLRLLRFFRFYAHYGAPPLDEEGLAACRASAHLLPSLSGERVQAEVFKLLEADTAPEVLTLMAGHGILDHVLPELSVFDRLARLMAIERSLAAAPSPVRRLAAAIGEGAQAARAVAVRLRLSNRDRNRLIAIADGMQNFAPIEDSRTRRHWYYRHGAQLYAELLIEDAAHRGIPASGITDIVAEAQAWQRPHFPIGGADAKAAGLAPGPRMGEILRMIEDWWVEHDFAPDRAACLDHLESLAKKI